MKTMHNPGSLPQRNLRYLIGQGSVNQIYAM